MAASLAQAGYAAGVFWTPGGSTARFLWDTELPSLWSVDTTPGFPEGGYALKQDCSTAPGSARVQMGIRASKDDATYQMQAVPDQSKRWALHWWQSWAMSAVPSSGQMKVLELGRQTVSDICVFADSAGHIVVKLASGGALSTGTVALVGGTKYVIDVWQVLVSGGANLTTYHYCLRVLSGCFAGGAPTVVDTLHWYAQDQAPVGVYAITFLGDDTTTNFGCTQEFSISAFCMEDADNPFGQFRTTWEKPTANGTTQTYTAAGGTALGAVQNMPPPADASVTNYLDGTNGQVELFKTTGQAVNSSLTPGVSDQAVWLQESWRTSGTSTKGSTLKVGEPTLYDGTNTSAITTLGNDPTGGSPTGPYQAYNHRRTLNAAGAAWAVANYGGGASENQIGLTQSSTGGHQYVDGIAALAIWVKSGETLAAVPGSDIIPMAFAAPGNQPVFEKIDVVAY